MTNNMKASILKNLCEWRRNFTKNSEESHDRPDWVEINVQFSSPHANYRQIYDEANNILSEYDTNATEFANIIFDEINRQYHEFYNHTVEHATPREIAYHWASIMLVEETAEMFENVEYADLYNEYLNVPGIENVFNGGNIFDGLYKDRGDLSDNFWETLNDDARYASKYMFENLPKEMKECEE